MSARSPFLLAPDVAARYHCHVRSVQDMAAAGRIPHKRLPGTRRLLFMVADLERWESGATLEVVPLEDGGRIVRPVDGVR